ncbi:tRNA pseudouridine(55) synthase TruB [Lujinxingia litoralis]|uniref:tRNA pseudouridine synthase B n=1 Tax=Lujinxingia litoralis TaxID=2211119 RepID=A0A328CAY9_9DELT|nr:tRNA pseudouridine(55) synthase TruB [Lujinxingia litoralis]RAL25342.1 tRNA pseudouridine(55) synthase TruB [Lujinxingia litoralis]
MQCQDGLILIDKVGGMTSFDVVRRVRRLAGTRKVGHTGTLDPDATGLMGVVLGRCTKLANYLTLDEKVYAFEMELGTATDTEDASGQVIAEADWEHVTREAFEEAIGSFLGTIEQVPPIYSALKVDGKRAHALARAGEKVELQARPVEIFELDLVEWTPPRVRLQVRCGSGTYVRALARDLGKKLGSVAHTRSIRRLSVGRFDLARAHRLEDLSEETFWASVLSPAEMVASLVQVTIDADQRRAIGFGQTILVEPEIAMGAPVAAIDAAGDLVAIMERKESYDPQGSRLAPRRVLI